MTDWKDKYEDLKDKYDDLAAVLLQANLALSEAGVGEHASFTERLACLLEDCQRALGASTADHQRMMDAHRAVTRNFPTGAEPDANTTLSLAERIDALARTSQRVGYDAGWLAAREQDLQGQAREVAEVAALRGRLADFEDDFRQVMAEGCGKIDDGWDTVTQHCACVPHLRRRVRELEATVAAVDAALRMRDEATYHADPPALPLAKRVAEECAWERQRGLVEAIAACVAALRDRAQRYVGHEDGHDRYRAEHIESDAAYLEREVTL
jgi:hypothetical protein